MHVHFRSTVESIDFGRSLSCSGGCGPEAGLDDVRAVALPDREVTAAIVHFEKQLRLAQGSEIYNYA